MSLAFPDNPTSGQTVTAGGKIWQYNGYGWVPQLTHIIPAHNETYDLGHSLTRWRDLYLSGNTIDLGGTNIKSYANGIVFTSAVDQNLAVPLTVGGIKIVSNGNIISLQVTDEGLATVSNTGNLTPIGGIISTKSIDELLDVDTGAPLDGQALIWDDNAGKWVPGNVALSGGGGGSGGVFSLAGTMDFGTFVAPSVTTVDAGSF